MRKSLFYTIIIVCLCSFLLTGCQLALPEANAEHNRDQMVGVLVTREPLDMADSPYTEPVSIELTQADIRRMEQGDFSVLDFPERRYYAQLVTEAFTNPDTGEVSRMQSWSFDHLGGWALMSPTMTDENGNEYVDAGSSDAMCGVKIHLKETDTSQELILSGTLYQLLGGDDMVFEMNPIYQTADGQVYATPGNGGFFESGSGTEGEAFTFTQEGEQTETAGTETFTHRSEVAVTIGKMFRPVRIVILQMNADGILLEQTEYEAGHVPDELTPQAKTAFLIIQTVKQKPDGSELITTTLADQSMTTFSSFFVKDDLCMEQQTRLNWPEA